MTRKAKTAHEAEIPKLAEVEALASPAADDAREVLAVCERLTISTAAEAEFAANALREVAQRRDEIDKQRKRWVEPLKSVAKEIDAAFRPAIKSLEAAEAAIKLALGRYALAEDEHRAAALREASALAREGEHGAAASVLEEASARGAPALAGVSVRAEWVGEVVDASAIPREYLTPDLAKLAAITRATDGDPKIPGWRAYQEARVRTSRKAGEE